MKCTIGDYIRLLQAQQEFDRDIPRDIEVTWVDSLEAKNELRNITYSPLPSQRRFHRSAGRLKATRANRIGKSAALCHEAIRLDISQSWTYRVGPGAPTYPMLRDATLAALTEILHANDIPYELNKSEFVITMKDTGSRILLRSLMSLSGCGYEPGWSGVDELTYTCEEAWLRRRTTAGSTGNAPFRIRGVDSQGT